MLTTTSRCSEYDHPEFRITHDELIPNDDVEWLASVLVRSVSEGSRFSGGELIDLGSMLLRLRRSGQLIDLQEPLLGQVPIRWQVGVSNSLRLLRLQKDVAASVGQLERIEFAKLRSWILVGVDVDPFADSFLLERVEHVESDSGWFVGLPDSRIDYGNADSLRRISVFEAISDWPRVAGFLALPTGSRVEIGKTKCVISYLDETLTPEKGSLLDEASTFQ